MKNLIWLFFLLLILTSFKYENSMLSIENSVTKAISYPSTIVSISSDSIIYICTGEKVYLEAPFDATMYSYFKWYRDGIALINEQEATLVTNIPGNYSLEAYDNETLSKAETCPVQGKIIIAVKNCVEICDNGEDDDNDGLIDCADTSCTCTCESKIRGEISNTTYLDNDTPADLADDSFIFNLSVRNASSSAGWSGGGQSGEYGQTVLFGPYPVDQEAARFKVMDKENVACFFMVSVNMSSCTYTGSCTCCAKDVESKE